MSERVVPRFDDDVCLCKMYPGAAPGPQHAVECSQYRPTCLPASDEVDSSQEARRGVSNTVPTPEYKLGKLETLLQAAYDLLDSGGNAVKNLPSARALLRLALQECIYVRKA